jgi:hypothetical protein|eukprot:4140305-Prymnesium_polylepis.2
MRDLRKRALWELLHSDAYIPHRTWSYAQMVGELQRFSFVASPASRGQDTYRFWEAITLGAIPIVLAGPLDSLYTHLPCVIVDSWANITAEKLLGWRAHIIEAFGPRPQTHPRVARMLSSSFYARKIENGESILPRATHDFRSTPRAIVNHTCDLSRGGVMPLAHAGQMPKLAKRRAELGCEPLP